MKVLFYQTIQRQRKDRFNNILDHPLKIDIFKDIFKDRNVEEVNMKNSILFIVYIIIEFPILSKYECVLFSLLLSCLNNVKVLNFSKNCITMLNIRHILQGVQNYTKLEYINLRGNSMHFTSQKLLSNVLIRNRNIEYLNLRCTREYHIYFLNIPKWCDGLKLILNNCSNLKKLNIQSIYIY